MKLITHTNPKILIADEGKKIKAINDIAVAEHKDEKTGEIIPAYEPYYATVIFPAKQIDTLDKAKELYEEVKIENEK